MPPDKAHAFDYNLDYRSIDFRKEPERYRVGKGEQGVLLVEPYKSEILPHWRFRTPDLARASAEVIFAMFLECKKNDDFVRMDMARKFLQMGWTRSRRYANYRFGRKYDPITGAELPREEDLVKAESARIFREYYDRAGNDPEYVERKRRWIQGERGR